MQLVTARHIFASEHLYILRSLDGRRSPVSLGRCGALSENSGSQPPRDDSGGYLLFDHFQPFPRLLGGILKSPRAYRIAETPPIDVVRKL